MGSGLWSLQLTHVRAWSTRITRSRDFETGRETIGHPERVKRVENDRCNRRASVTNVARTEPAHIRDREDDENDQRSVHRDERALCHPGRAKRIEGSALHRSGGDPNDGARILNGDDAERTGSAANGWSDLFSRTSKTLMAWVERSDAPKRAARPGEEYVRPLPFDRRSDPRSVVRTPV
jgi:hypothetical protein